MTRIALRIEYDGTDFFGWQRQPGVRTVQGCVERAVSQVADAPITVVCAGRTDRGVHALGQIIHFDTVAAREPRNWILGVNANLPADISIRWCKHVPDSFHARFSARVRHYRYTILNRPTRPALLRNRVCWTHRPLSVEHMQSAAAALLGEHDFSAYRAVACQARSPVRTLYRLDVRRANEKITIDVVANAFLHHMVRNIAGVLMRIGAGHAKPAWAAEVLASRDRRRGGMTAPAAGLCLVRVDYGEETPHPNPLHKVERE
jgi:tRNA pseudouridine38-40 synthase